MKRLTPIQSIRAKCMDCTVDQFKEIRLCTSIHCPLHPYRMGKRPTEEYYEEIAQQDAELAKKP